MKKEIAIAHPVSIKDVGKIEDPGGYVFPSMVYGVVTHQDVPPGTVMIWPQGGVDPVVMQMDELVSRVKSSLSHESAFGSHPLTSPIPGPPQYTGFQPGHVLPTSPPDGAFLAAVDAEIKAAWKATSEKMVSQLLHGTPVVPPPAPEVELIDSSNPFAKALDAWQTGKAAWDKGALHKPATQGEPA